MQQQSVVCRGEWEKLKTLSSVTYSSKYLPMCFGQNLVERQDSGETWLFMHSVVKIAWSLYIYLLHMDIQSLSWMYKTWGNNVWQGCDCVKASVCLSTFTHFSVHYHCKTITVHYTLSKEWLNNLGNTDIYSLAHKVKCRWSFNQQLVTLA